MSLSETFNDEATPARRVAYNQVCLTKSQYLSDLRAQEYVAARFRLGFAYDVHPWSRFNFPAVLDPETTFKWSAPTVQGVAQNIVNDCKQCFERMPYAKRGPVIIKITAMHTGIADADMMSRTRLVVFMGIRTIAIVIAAKFGISLSEQARLWDRDHKTIYTIIKNNTDKVMAGVVM